MELTPTKDKYYLIFDNFVQWFSYAVRANETIRPELKGWSVLENYDVPEAPFIENLLDKEPNFLNRFFQGSGIQSGEYYGWAISEVDFAKIKKISELEKFNKEYTNLINS